MKRRFSPHKHLWKYSLSLLRSLAAPIIAYLVIIGNVLLVICAFLFYQFETASNEQVKTFFDAVWWAFCTVTTVGYGDIAPATLGGRVVGIFLMVSGASFFFGFTAILISTFSSMTTEEVIQTERLTKAEYEDVLNKLATLTEKVERLDTKLSALGSFQADR